MNSDIVSRWIETGKMLAEDKNAKVDYPVCQAAKLKITDVRSELNHEELERHIICTFCGEKNSLKLVRPE